MKIANDTVYGLPVRGPGESKESRGSDGCRVDSRAPFGAYKQSGRWSGAR